MVGLVVIVVVVFVSVVVFVVVVFVVVAMFVVMLIMAVFMGEFLVWFVHFKLVVSLFALTSYVSLRHRRHTKPTP